MDERLGLFGIGPVSREQVEDAAAQRPAGDGASAISGLSVGPEAASAAAAASPAKSPAECAPAMSKIMSPIAMPPRARALGAVTPGGLNTPSGKFCSGNSPCPFAEATQLVRFASWVSSIIAPLPGIVVPANSNQSPAGLATT